MTELPPPQTSAPASPPPPVPVPPPAYAPVTAVSVVERKTGPGLLVRAIWVVFVGWWLTAIVSAVAWLAMITIIGLALGIWLVNRIPTALTLRPRTSYVTTYTDALGRAVSHETHIDQPPWYVRGLWFVFVGWWLSGLAMSVGWVLCVLILTLPLGLMVYNRVPFLASLYRY